MRWRCWSADAEKATVGLLPPSVNNLTARSGHHDWRDDVVAAVYARGNPVSMSDPDGRQVAVSCWLSSWVFDDGWHFAGFRHGTCASPLPTGPGDTGNQEPGGGGRESGQTPAGPAGHTPDPDTPNPDSPGPGPGPTPPVPDPDPKPDPKRRNCYQTWRFRSLFDSAPSTVQLAVDFVDAASTFSFASDVYATGLKNAGRTATRWVGTRRLEVQLRNCASFEVIPRDSAVSIVCKAASTSGLSRGSVGAADPPGPALAFALGVGASDGRALSSLRSPTEAQ
jgi:hypothetical protein